jgi:two-component system nitrate/nitrite response regulator NarL
MNANPITLMLIDDHVLFRRGLVALLGQDEAFQVLCEAGDIGEAMRCLERTQPDLILLDNHLPGVKGVDAIESLRQLAPRARILMLTVSEDAHDLQQALRAGADGYLLKTIDADELVAALVRVAGGTSVVSPEMTTKLVAALRETVGPIAGAAPGDVATAMSTSDGDARAAIPDDPLERLSPREREILVCLARGASNKHIARELDIAETTVKIHVQHILRKLGLSSRVQAAVFASSRGLH